MREMCYNREQTQITAGIGVDYLFHNGGVQMGCDTRNLVGQDYIENYQLCCDLWMEVDECKRGLER